MISIKKILIIGLNKHAPLLTEEVLVPNRCVRELEVGEDPGRVVLEVQSLRDGLLQL